jgi:hypothetical protein
MTHETIDQVRRFPVTMWAVAVAGGRAEKRSPGAGSLVCEAVKTSSGVAALYDRCRAQGVIDEIAEA